ncbi:MAG: hypothetical protein RII27_07840, partial [Alphaproteobacteria bacterium]
MALLLLAACADTTAWQAELGSFYDSLGASQESIMARGSVHLSGPPPAMDVWCYRTLARPDCLPEPLWRSGITGALQAMGHADQGLGQTVRPGQGAVAP